MIISLNLSTEHGLTQTTEKKVPTQAKTLIFLTVVTAVAVG